MLAFSELLDQVQLKTSQEKENLSRFVFGPLPVGFGHTLGSVLRRTLLSSIPGAAVTQFKVEGVSHPFMAVPGIREDVIEFILNIKRIRLRIFNNQPVILKATVSGLKPFRACDLEVVGEAEVVSQDLVLANPTDKKTKLIVELTAEPGVGYETAEEHASNKIGVIPVDSIFTPVTSVSYSVGQARLGQVTNLDSLILDVGTDGTIEPEAAVRQACDTLRDFFSVFNLERKSEDQAVSKLEAEAGLPAAVVGAKDALVSVEDLGLSTRTVNALLRSKIKNLGDLSSRRDELGKVKGLGQKGLGEIKDLMEKQSWK